jgi:hypothetical protein
MPRGARRQWNEPRYATRIPRRRPTSRTSWKGTRSGSSSPHRYSSRPVAVRMVMRSARDRLVTTDCAGSKAFHLHRCFKGESMPVEGSSAQRTCLPVAGRGVHHGNPGGPGRSEHDVLAFDDGTGVVDASLSVRSRSSSLPHQDDGPDQAVARRCATDAVKECSPGPTAWVDPSGSSTSPMVPVGSVTVR